ncbi:hypothetical protein [Subtercola endophyticus]|uniref:hypothetical protein n=1 Tax=Subtercola endophyticus TaxID=2895559 RepID=UPI001E48D435|nr:hypothetical protein [Subtercola endophyticus]UFS59503.1 hypothetical protein LQ955_01495 [Subtercola endophyticus]
MTFEVWRTVEDVDGWPRENDLISEHDTFEAADRAADIGCLKEGAEIYHVVEVGP